MNEPKKDQPQDQPSPKWWQKRIIQLLAAGDFTAEWLTEFIELFELVLREEGEQAAESWALQELSLSVKFSIALRVYRLIRLIVRARNRQAAED